MSATVDERIVSAKFDASDFEKGVDKTIKKLDELKKSFNLKETTDSVKELSEKTEASTKSIGSSLDKLTDRFTNFTGMVKQKLLSGLADEVAGVFLKMEQSVKHFITGISTEQISNGMGKYEQMLASVRTMIAGGKSEREAYDAISVLAEYSDQTSYSLTQMTDALSKFVAAGVDLDTATNSVEGIANACANAGINATDASRAFYNLSQAYSSGSLKYTDYRSLELLNMTTEKFKENLLEAAVQAGTLKKLAEGTYQTVAKKGEKITGGKKVTTQNLQQSLSYGFMTKDAMNELFGGKFGFDEKKLRAIVSKYEKMGQDARTARDNAIAEAKKEYGELAVNAYLAAKEARSFTDVINTLKDVVSTGWSTTFENLFGRLEQAKDFFTDLAEGELADFIYKIGEYRNAVLGFWNVMDVNGNGSGAAIFTQTILNIADAIGTLLKTFLQVLPGFDELNNEEDDTQKTLENLGERLFRISLSIRDFSNKIKKAAEDFNEFMNSPMFTDGPTRIEAIRNIFANLNSVLGIVGKLIGIASTAFNRMFYAISPILDGIIQFLEKITEPLVTLKNNQKVFNDLEDGASNILSVLEKITPVIGTIVSFLGEVAAFFAQIAIDTVTANIEFFGDALGLVMELFTGSSGQKLRDGEGVLGHIKNDFEGIKNACSQAIGFVKQFFDALIGDLRELFGLTEKEGVKGDGSNQNGGIFSRLANLFDTSEFISNAKAWIDQAIVDVGAFIKSIPSKVMTFGANIYDTLRGLFFEDTTQYNGSQLETTTILTPLGQWLDQAIIDIREFVISIPQKILTAVGTVGNWIDGLFDGLFNQEPADTKKNSKETAQSNATETVLDQFNTFLSGIVTSVKTWIDDLPNKISELLTKVGNFTGNVLNALDEFLFGKKVTKSELVKDERGRTSVKMTTTRYKKGFSKFLDNIIKEIKKFIAQIPTYVKAGIKGAGDIISQVIGAIFGTTDGSTDTTSKEIEQKLEKPFLDINLTSVIESIKTLGRNILNAVVSIFTGTDELELSQMSFIDTIVFFFKNLWNNVKTFAGDLWNGFSDALFGNANTTEQQNLAALIGTFIGNAIGNFFTWAGNVAVDIYSGFSSVFEGKENETGEEQSVAAKIGAWIANTIEKVFDWAKDVAVDIYEGFSNVFTGNGKPGEQDSVAAKIGAWIANTIKTAFDWAKNVAVDIYEGFSGVFTGNGKPGEQDSAAAKIGAWIANTIKTVFDWARDVAVDIYEGFSGVFTGNGKPGEQDSAAANIGDWIATAMVNIWNFVKDAGINIWNGFSQLFSGGVSDTDKKKAQKSVSEAINSVTSALGSDPKPEGIENERKSLAKNIGTILAGAIQDAWKWISTNVSDIFGGFAAVFEGKEINDGDSTAKKIGVAIAKIFINVWKEAGNLVSDIYMGISSLFTGDIPATERAKAIAELATKIGDFFTCALKLVFGNNNKEVIEKNKLEKIDPLALMNNRLENMSQIKVTPITEKLSEAFSEIGPAILNGLGKALDAVGNIFTWIIDRLTGKESLSDEIDKKYKKEKPELADALHKIGQSLETFLLDTLPKFIGAAIGKISTMVPDWIGKLFGAFSDATKDETEQAKKDLNSNNPETLEDSVTTLWETLANIFDTLLDKATLAGAGGILKILAIAVAIKMVLEALRDIVSLGDELEAAADVVKWVAVLSAINTISGIVAMIADAVNNDVDGKKMENLNTVFEGFKETLGIIKDIAIIYASIKGGTQMVSSIAEAIGNVKSSTNLAAGAIDIAAYTGKAGKVAKSIGNVAKSAGSKVLNVLGNVTAIAGAETILSGATAISTDMLGTGVADALSNLGSGVDDLLYFVDPFVADLVELYGKIDTAIDAVKKLKDLFIELFKAFGEMYYRDLYGIDDSAYKRLTDGSTGDVTATIAGIEKYIEDLSGVMESFMLVSNMVKTFSDAFSSLSKVENMDAKFDDLNSIIGSKKFKDFLKNIFEKSRHAWTMSWTNGTHHIKDSEFVIGLQVVSNVLSIFSDSVNGLDDSSITAFDKALDVLYKLTEVFGDAKLTNGAWQKIFSEDTSLVAVGSQIKRFSVHMKTFFDNIKDVTGFDNLTYDSTNRKVEAIIKVVQGLVDPMIKLSKDGYTEDIFNAFGADLDGVGQVVSDFIQNTGDYMDNTSNITDEQLERVKNAVEILSELANVIHTFADMGNYGYINLDGVLNFSALTESILNAFNLNADEKKNGGAGYKLLAAMIAMIQAAKRQLSDKKATEEFDSLGKEFAVQVATSIASAFNDSNGPTITITPVLNLDPAKGQLKEFLGIENFGPIDLGGMARAAFGLNSFTEQRTIDYTTTLDNILAAIEDRSDYATVQDVANAFTGIQIVTNTGVLVGEITDQIDEAIGQKIWEVTRGMAVSPGES